MGYQSTVMDCSSFSYLLVYLYNCIIAFYSKSITSRSCVTLRPIGLRAEVDPISQTGIGKV